MIADLLVRGGTVHDGTGAEPIRADVAVRDGRIDAIGDGLCGEGEAARVLDATGLVVAPGFIDIHSHSDDTLLLDPRAVSAIHQGVTLEVVGNCGHGCFPIRDVERARRAIYGYADAHLLTWSSAAGYFAALEEARPAVNVLSLVPNGQLRLSVVGLEDRPATKPELAEMSRLLEESLDQGAWGYSTGLEYAQERGAPEQELTALSRVAALHGGLYATHTRKRDAGAAEAVEEAVRTARDAGARLQVSHLVPRSGEEEAHRCLAAVEAGARDGLDLAFDMHTRLYGTTFLQTALPPHALGAGPEELRTLLASRSAREEMKRYESILSAGGDWSRIVVLDNDVEPGAGRRDIASIAAEQGVEPLDAVYDLLAAALPDPSRLMVLILCYTEERQREAFAHPLCTPGSDATTLAPDGVLAGSTFHGAYTWASWFYRFMVRQERALTPAEAVHRLTGAPAARLGLRDRGVLRVGAWADVAVFDHDRFGERGTTFEPNQLAEGMRHVVVNGVVTLDGGVR
ncbi:MAG: amidohydrolase family protein, partial [Actinobacteria bacterium]|nr:amidohydrolase family protein [Actinomycetota bacterium]